MAKTTLNKTQAASAKNVRKSSVGWMIKMLSMSMDHQMKMELKPYDLTMEHFKIMMTLLEKDGLTQAQIGEKILMPAYSLTRNLDALELKDLIKRDKHHSSRRSHSILVTDKGKALAPNLFNVVHHVNRELLSSLNNSEVLQFKTTLAKLLDNQSRQKTGTD